MNLTICWLDILRICAVVICALAVAGCGKGQNKDESAQTGKKVSASRNLSATFDVKRLNRNKYEKLDAKGIAQELLTLDVDGQLKKDLEKSGGIDMLVKEINRREEAYRHKFTNLFLLRDALKLMGVSPDTFKAFIVKSREADDVLEQKTDELIAILPTVAKLHKALSDIGTPPEDLSDALFEYLDEKAENRAEKETEILGGVKRYVAVQDVIVKAGMSKAGVEKGLAGLAFPRASGKSKSQFERDAEIYSELNTEGIDALAPGCAKMIAEMKRMDISEDQMVECIVTYLAAPANEREKVLDGIAMFAKTFASNREKSGDTVAAMAAFDSMMSGKSGDEDTTGNDDTEAKRYESLVAETRNKARKIFIGIKSANIEREPLGLGDIWPHTKANLIDDGDDIAGKAFSNVGDYFSELLDLQHFGTKECMPYCQGLAVSDWYAKAFSKGAKIDPAEIMWSVAMDVTDDLSDNAPILISSNFVCTNLRQNWDGVTDADKKFLPPRRSGFPLREVVVVRKNGVISVFDKDEGIMGITTPRDIYGQLKPGETFKGPKAYLTPKGIVETKR